MPKKTALILVNLGTPEAPTRSEVRRFLRSFLSDRRVVDLPRLFWLPLLYGVILPFRSPKVAKLYKKIWWESGSPLKVITEQQTKKLAQRLTDTDVGYAMVYGAPSLAQSVSRAFERGAEKIAVLPLYPQFCSATTGSVIDQIEALKVWYLQQKQTQIELQLSVKDYHSNPAYIAALASSVENFWKREGKAEKLLFSFHGIPQKLADSGDPYYQQCMETASLVAKKLQLPAQEWQVCFQSRFGKAEWIKPYTDLVISDLGEQGVKDIDVVTPAFASDCLETLEEISVENAELFKFHGGNRLRLIPCLNDNDAHIDMMAALFAS